MRPICRRLLDKSISAALAAIEIYNKPDFRYREESFVILVVNAWELLLKAKLLKDAGGKLRTLYVYQGKRIKRNRTGNPMTIEIIGAMRQLALDPPVAENIAAFIEIRDTCVHFYCSDPLRYIVYSLGVATLHNYQRLVDEWFGVSLLDYNFYIMPLAFAHSFKTLKMLDLDKSPPVIANLVKAVSVTQEQLQNDTKFQFACEIGVELKSAKKFAAAADLTVKIDPSAKDAATVIIQTKKKLDQYPYSYKELVERVRQTLPTAKATAIQAVIKADKVKENESLSAYSFRVKAQEDAYLKSRKLPKGITSIYNEDAVRHIIQRLEELDGKAS